MKYVNNFLVELKELLKKGAISSACLAVQTFVKFCGKISSVPIREVNHMIMRIFKVTTRAGKEAEFARFFHETAIPLMRTTNGIVSVFPGESRPETPREFSFVMIWESLEALKAFAGENYTNPHIDSAEANLVESRSISHYNLVE